MPLTDKQINKILSDLVGNRVRLSYKGGQADLASHGGGYATHNVGRIHVNPEYYRLIRSRKVGKGLDLAMGLLGHELGHLTPENVEAQKGKPNASGGIDKDPRVWETMADEYAYANMRRLYNALGYRPHVARQMAVKSTLAFKKFRSKNPY